MDESRAETSQEQQPVQPPAPPNPLKQIRTFQGDVAEALGRQKEFYSIQAQERAKGAPTSTSTAPAPSLLLLLGGVLIILIAGGGGWYTYQAFLKKTAAPVVTAPASRLLSVESSAALDLASLSREEIFQKFAEASTGAKPNELRHIIFKSATSTTAFLEKLETSAPGSLVRALEPVFMAGALGSNRFLIFKVISFENAYPGMLNWEKTLPSDLGSLFSTAEAVKSIGSTYVFKDAVYRNKDARALFFEEEPVLLYSFLDREFLIITESPQTLQALIDRLTREKLTR